MNKYFVRPCGERNRPLQPWVQGNESVTPANFFGNHSPSCEYGMFIGIDVAVELYLAETIDTGNLEDSWSKNNTYIEKAMKIANRDPVEDGYDLDNEEKIWILDELGEPPCGSYNLYFITIYNENEEILMYIGKTDSRKSRFRGGHTAALKLHDPKYNGYKKRVYFGTVCFISEEDGYLPMEFIQPFSVAKKLLSEVEAFLIRRLESKLNKAKGEMGSLKKMNSLHIQNFSGESDFLNDKILFGD